MSPRMWAVIHGILSGFIAAPLSAALAGFTLIGDAAPGGGKSIWLTLVALVAALIPIVGIVGLGAIIFQKECRRTVAAVGVATAIGLFIFFVGIAAFLAPVAVTPRT